DPEFGAMQVPGSSQQVVAVRAERDERGASHKRLSSSIENCIGHDASERTAHQGPTLPRSDELLARQGENELHEVSIEVREGLGTCAACRRRGTSELSLQASQRSQILNKARPR